jgi:DNA/RNA endonuclease G (NUC1)
VRLLFLSSAWFSVKIKSSLRLKTAEHLTAASLGRGQPTPQNPEETKLTGDRNRSAFAEDESIPLPFRARLQDYFRSGYDRGHMCVVQRGHFAFSNKNHLTAAL